MSESVLARYPTVGGETVDVAHVSHSLYVTATCNGCPLSKDFPIGGRIDATPEEEAWRVDRVVPEASAWAEAHAKKCH